MELAFDVSFTDYPQELGIDHAQTWAKRGLDNVFDSVLAAGVRRVHFRSHAAGPWWPTQIAGAAPCTVAQSLDPSFEQWNAVAAAVERAHAKGIKLVAWFDIAEGHCGHPTRWGLSHPECAIVNRSGVRADGTTGDPLLSYAYPAVIEYRLALIRELLAMGVDGLFLVVCHTPVGYEEPARSSFAVRHGVDPLELPGDDPRWTAHQAGFVTDFFRKVCTLVAAERNRAGRPIETILEAHSIQPALYMPNGPDVEEPGWPNVPEWARMPATIDVETIARERLVDALCFWRMSEIDALSEAVRDNVRLATRFRMKFTKDQYDERRAAAEDRGVDLFIVNEARWLLADNRWIYPGAPGPIYTLRQQTRKASGFGAGSTA